MELHVGMTVLGMEWWNYEEATDENGFHWMTLGAGTTKTEALLDGIAMTCQCANEHGIETVYGRWDGETLVIKGAWQAAHYCESVLSVGVEG